MSLTNGFQHSNELIISEAIASLSNLIPEIKQLPTPQLDLEIITKRSLVPVRVQIEEKSNSPIGPQPTSGFNVVIRQLQSGETIGRRHLVIVPPHPADFEDPTNKTAYGSLFVYPEYEGLGIGTGLIRSTEQVLTKAFFHPSEAHTQSITHFAKDGAVANTHNLSRNGWTSIQLLKMGYTQKESAFDFVKTYHRPLQP